MGQVCSGGRHPAPLGGRPHSLLSSPHCRARYVQSWVPRACAKQRTTGADEVSFAGHSGGMTIDPATAAYIAKALGRVEVVAAQLLRGGLVNQCGYGGQVRSYNGAKHSDVIGKNAHERRVLLAK